MVDPYWYSDNDQDSPKPACRRCATAVQAGQEYCAACLLILRPPAVIALRVQEAPLVIYYPVQVVGETPARCRVRTLVTTSLPARRGRVVVDGTEVLVPRYCVGSLPAGQRVEDCGYPGRILGYARIACLSAPGGSGQHKGA